MTPIQKQNKKTAKSKTEQNPMFQTRDPNPKTETKQTKNERKRKKDDATTTTKPVNKKRQ